MGSKMIGEKTEAQVVTSQATTFAESPPTYATYRQMAKHPTIAVGRALAAAPILASDWSVEKDDDASDEWVKLIQEEVLNKRHQFLEHAVYGRIDYGFAPFELVWGISDEGWLVLNKVKPLVQELTELLVGEDHGELIGIKQGEVSFGLECAMVLSFGVRGTNWYGEALIENCREAWNGWMEANAGAKRYDKRVAGGHVVSKYPQGESEYNGVMMDNQLIAKDVVDTLEAAGSVCIPNQQRENALGELEEQWSIIFDSSGSGMQPQFITRLEYFDKLMARGLLLPERALQEGSKGTLAEAETHGETALVIGELASQTVLLGVNQQMVDRILVYNFGTHARGKVRCACSPLANKQREFLEGIYTSFLADPNGFMTESDQIDTDAIKDILGVPKSQEVAQSGTAIISDITPTDPRAATTRRVYEELSE